MKSTNLFFFVFATVSMYSCKNNSSDAAKQYAGNVSTYVDSIEAITPVYSLGYWNALDSGYQQRALAAEKNIAALEAADKAKLDSSKVKYAMLKTNYEAKLKEQEAAANMKLKATEATLKTEVEKNKTLTADIKPDYRQVLRNRLFGEGKIGTDMKFDFVNAQNILGIYQGFVNTVAANKNNYTREDWDEIKVLYEALDNRKNYVEKDLATKNNMKIAGLKIRFASIKATHRFAAKANENADSKK